MKKIVKPLLAVSAVAFGLLISHGITADAAAFNTVDSLPYCWSTTNKQTREECPLFQNDMVNRHHSTGIRNGNQANKSTVKQTAAKASQVQPTNESQSAAPAEPVVDSTPPATESAVPVVENTAPVAEATPDTPVDNYCPQPQDGTGYHNGYNPQGNGGNTNNNGNAGNGHHGGGSIFTQN